jgi:hypothetical protein
LQHRRDEISFSALWRRRLRSGCESENGARIISSVSSQIGWFVVLVRLRLLVFGADSRSGGPARDQSRRCRIDPAGTCPTKCNLIEPRGHQSAGSNWQIHLIMQAGARAENVFLALRETRGGGGVCCLMPPVRNQYAPWCSRKRINPIFLSTPRLSARPLMMCASAFLAESSSCWILAESRFHTALFLLA